MARRPNYGAEKRQKEIQRQKKKEEKDEKKRLRKEAAAARDQGEEGARGHEQSGVPGVASESDTVWRDRPGRN